VKQTSHVMACEFVTEDHIAQLCLRIVQWLEGLASKALDLEAKVLFSYIFCTKCWIVCKWHVIFYYLL